MAGTTISNTPNEFFFIRCEFLSHPSAQTITNQPQLKLSLPAFAAPIPLTEISDQASGLCVGSPFTVGDISVGKEVEAVGEIAFGEVVEAILGLIDRVDPRLILLIPD